MNKPQSAILTEQDFRAAISSQCGFPSLLQSAESDRRLQLKDREPTDAEVLSALQFALGPEAACLNFALDKIEKAMNPSIEFDEKAEHENDLRHESLMADDSEYGPVCNERDEIGGRQ